MENKSITNNTVAWSHHAVKWGFIFSLIKIILLLVIYMLDYTLLLDWKVKSIIVLVSVLGWILIGRGYYKGASFTVRFNTVFFHGLVLFCVLDLVVLIFNLFLYNLVDPYLPGKLADEASEKTEEVLKQFMSAEQLQNELLIVREKILNAFGVTQQVKALVFSLIGNLVWSALSGLIIWKRQSDDK